MQQEQEEYKLAVRARAGDREALAELVERLRLRLFAQAYGLLRHYEDAQDAVASALIRICLHVQDLRDPKRMTAWMQTVVRNEAHRLRRRSRFTTEIDPEQTGTGEDTTAEAVLRMDVCAALHRLPADQGRAIGLFYLGGLPIQEIARRVGRPEGTVKSWLHQGRQRLAHEMKGYQPMETGRSWTATIVSTDLEETLLQELMAGLKAAGFANVQHISDYTAAAHLEQTGEGETQEFHLPVALRNTDFLILDEWIGGRSVFELCTLLRAAVEMPAVSTCLFLNKVDPPLNDISLHAAWTAGFDLVLNRPIQPAEFQRFAALILKGKREAEEK